MGLLSKLFGWKIRCPDCGASSAKDSFAGMYCLNPQCRNYDPLYAQSVAAAKTGYTQRNLRTGAQEPLSESTHFTDPLRIEYLNFLNERKEFSCERESIRQRGSRISVRVEPTGRRITLAPKRIKNLSEVQAAMHAQQPDFTDSLEIVYENFRGERKTFRGARKSVRRKGNNISVCVAPRGVRISLNRDRILNWPAVERKIG